MLCAEFPDVNLRTTCTNVNDNCVACADYFVLEVEKLAEQTDKLVYNFTFIIIIALRDINMICNYSDSRLGTVAEISYLLIT